RDHPHAPQDLLGRDQLALAGARADRARLLPRRRAGDVAVPERPGAALARPHRVDGAAGRAVVEHAVAVGLLAQGPAAAGHPGVEQLHLFEPVAPVLGDGGQLLVVDRDEAGSARAAVAAARAAEAQPAREPRLAHHPSLPVPALEEAPYPSPRARRFSRINGKWWA